MKRLHAEWGDRVHFVDVIVRQGHPGPAVPPYRTVGEKERDAERYRDEEAVPWPVAIDDLAGSVHAHYGMLADPVFLIGRDGRVAFYNYWTHVPTLHRALGHLMDLNGEGTVGASKAVHPLATVAGGWRAIERGLPQSFTDLETAMPGSASGLWLGHHLRGVLAPVAFTAKPWPARVTSSATTVAGALLVAGAYLWFQHTRAERRRAPVPARL